MAEKWINFRDLRDRLDFMRVLASYNVTVKVKANQAQGFCPLPTHPTHEGKRRSPSFSINLARGIWQCFSCGGRGNILDLVCRLEGLDPGRPGDIRKAAVMLEAKFPINEKPPSAEVPFNSKYSQCQKEDGAFAGKLLVNPPLDFALKHLDQEHPYLLKRGFTRATIEHFGLGFCSKGLMKDRVVIPLRDVGGNLIGYAGRVVNDAVINEENPRYRFPSRREKDRIRYEFKKSHFLYNGFAVSTGGSLRELIVVESFTATWWMTQCGKRNVVAVMGSTCSPEQAALIVAMTASEGLVTILSDGDESGRQCAHSIFAEVAEKRSVRWIKLDAGKQPTDHSDQELRDMF